MPRGSRHLPNVTLCVPLSAALTCDRGRHAHVPRTRHERRVTPSVPRHVLQRGAQQLVAKALCKHKDHGASHDPPRAPSDERGTQEPHRGPPRHRRPSAGSSTPRSHRPSPYVPDYRISESIGATSVVSEQIDDDSVALATASHARVRTSLAMVDVVLVPISIRLQPPAPGQTPVSAHTGPAAWSRALSIGTPLRLAVTTPIPCHDDNNTFVRRSNPSKRRISTRCCPS